MVAPASVNLSFSQESRVAENSQVTSARSKLKIKNSEDPKAKTTKDLVDEFMFQIANARLILGETESIDTLTEFVCKRNLSRILQIESWPFSEAFYFKYINLKSLHLSGIPDRLYHLNRLFAEAAYVDSAVITRWQKLSGKKAHVYVTKLLMPPTLVYTQDQACESAWSQGCNPAKL